MFCIEHTRTQGKRLTYEIEAMRDGSYLIRLNGQVLRGGLPDPARAAEGLFSSSNYTLRAIARAISDIELLVNMDEEPTPRPRRGPVTAVIKAAQQLWRRKRVDWR